MSFRAKFTSDCENCDVPIKEGDKAKMLDYDKKLVAHVKCPASLRSQEICSDCWLAHAGDCY